MYCSSLAKLKITHMLVEYRATRSDADSSRLTARQCLGHRYLRYKFVGNQLLIFMIFMK